MSVNPRNIAKEFAALGRLTVKDLRAKHVEVFGETTRSGNKDWLRKRIAWRIQANASGDLTEWARRIRGRADELANDADLRTTAPKDNQVAITTTASVAFDHDARLPMPGAILRRPYKGREIVVRVLLRGFEYEGEVYRTLSAVARTVTGTHWNGYHFFNLTPGKPGKNGVADE
jgi:hypothetical protein